METATKTGATQALNMVRDGLSTLAELGFTFRQQAELIEVLEAGPAIRAQLDSVYAVAAAEVDRWGLAKDAGYRTVDQMVADKTGADPVKIRADKRLGKWIDDFGHFASAWADGQILSEHLDLVRRAVDNPRTHQQLIEHQTMFMQWATELDFTDFERCCRYWVLANDPDGVEPKDQIRNTFVRLRKDADGCVKLTGLLDPILGRSLQAAVEHEEQKLFRAAKEADGPNDSTGRRTAVALAGLVARGFAREDGTFPVPLISVVASEQVIEDTITRLDNDSSDPLPLSFTDIDQRCELIDGTPIHPTYLLALLGVATFRRQILTATSRTIDVSLSARCFTPWQQHALRVEARGRCTTPGCDAPFAWLQGDHTHPHGQGGPTRLDNGAMKCGPDNAAKGNRLPNTVSKKPAA